MKAIFFDACSTMLSKNLLPIADIFSIRAQEFTAVFVSADTGGNTDFDVELKSENKIKSNENYTFIHFTSFNFYKIEAYLIWEKPDFFFIGAYRIYDELWVAICIKLGIKVFSQQHGFEIDSVFYKPNAFVHKISKVFRLTYAAYNLSKIGKCSFIKLYYQYCRYIIKGLSLNDTLLSNPNFQPTIAFVYSEYYKEFWNRKFGFNKSNMEIIMPTDFLLIKTVIEKEIDESCCYITQTLVEDGRMNEKEFITLLQSYRQLAKSIKRFIIKLHPQANADIYYKIFDGLENVIFTREFPHSTYYLTHYSSMAYTAAFLSNNIILHELTGHPTHEIFQKIASTIVHSTQEIIDYIKNADVSIPSLEERKDVLRYYCVYDEKMHPYEAIYEKIMQLY